MSHLKPLALRNLKIGSHGPYATLFAEDKNASLYSDHELAQIPFTTKQKN